MGYSKGNKLLFLLIFGLPTLAGAIWAVWDLASLTMHPKGAIFWARPVSILSGAVGVAVVPAWAWSINYEISPTAISKKSIFGAKSFGRAEIGSVARIGVNDLQLFLNDGAKAMTVTIDIIRKDPEWRSFIDGLKASDS